MKRLNLIDLLMRTYPMLSREQASSAIICGDVRIDGELCRDPKRLCASKSRVEIDGDQGWLSPSGQVDIPPLPYVSRGGNKLSAVLDAWQVPVAGRVWIDAGCSTGGFTHALLLRGARVVHAIDVGYNILDWRIRRLGQVRVHERTNIMDVESLDPKADAAVADLSFRSVWGAAQKLLHLCSEAYMLVKPQFERKYALSRSLSAPHDPETNADFAGIVTEGRELSFILSDVAVRLGAEGILLIRIMKAGVKGRSGNQEFVAHLKAGQGNCVQENLKTVEAVFIES